MTKYIDVNRIKYYHFSDRTFAYKEEIDEIPSADVAEVNHGKWVDNEDDFFVKCSCCNVEFNDEEGAIMDGRYLFCPHCGAKMDAGIEVK